MRFVVVEGADVETKKKINLNEVLPWKEQSFNPYLLIGTLFKSTLIISDVLTLSASAS
jgi:hypothetical protein